MFIINLNHLEIAYKSPRISQDDPHCEAWVSYEALTHTQTHTSALSPYTHTLMQVFLLNECTFKNTYSIQTHTHTLPPLVHFLSFTVYLLLLSVGCREAWTFSHSLFISLSSPLCLPTTQIFMATSGTV